MAGLLSPHVDKGWAVVIPFKVSYWPAEARDALIIVKKKKVEIRFGVFPKCLNK